MAVMPNTDPLDRSTNRTVGAEMLSALGRMDSEKRHPLYQSAWLILHALLLLSFLCAIYAIVWEYSARRYLKGFSDAIVPVAASPIEKTEAILDWMRSGPARQTTGVQRGMGSRDPINTLNYEALLKVCGSATNAFINLAASSGLKSRRLLLLDNHDTTKHVVAEVLHNGRWIIVDPAFRTIVRDTNGSALTAQELSDPSVFATAVGTIPGYDLSYTFDRTAHVRLGRLGLPGLLLRKILDRFTPGWEGSPMMSLLLERESLVAAVGAMLALILLVFARVELRRYGKRCLRVRPRYLRNQIRRAWEAFSDTAT